MDKHQRELLLKISIVIENKTTTGNKTKRTHTHTHESPNIKTQEKPGLSGQEILKRED
jgi:hypothetical protein